MPSSFAFLRVGRLDASSRQDIVLSGHFIKDEHCTFTSSPGPVGESKIFALLHRLVAYDTGVEHHCKYESCFVP